MIRSAAIGLLALGTAMAGCRGAPSTDVVESPPPADIAVEPITVAADRESYAPGATVELRIGNNGDRTWGFNACTRIVERHQGTNTWEQLREPDRVCTLQLALLEPRASRTVTTDLPRTLSPGTYRLTLSFSDQTPGSAGAVLASTQPFTVR